MVKRLRVKTIGQKKAEADIKATKEEIGHLPSINSLPGLRSYCELLEKRISAMEQLILTGGK